MKLSYIAIAAAAVLAFSSILHAQGAATVKVGGFIDTYFGYDFGRPQAIDRSFTTQAARHNEFNVNLAHIELVASGDKLRGRLALQAGTSVQSNYSGEPSVGSLSGASLARHIQEAVVGVQFGEGLWVDGGVFLSHIGTESWISRDNLTYTRSLIAEYSPYYQSGVKVTWSASSKVTVLATVVNGWQIISENNQDKAFGARIDIAATPKVSLGYYNFIGNEQPSGSEARLRMLHGVTAKLLASDDVTLTATADFGRQAGAGTDDASTWWGGALIAKAQLTATIGIAGRVESYSDDGETIVVTGGDPFRATGFSIGLDAAPQAGVLWRTEFKTLTGKDAVFPDRDGAAGLSKRNSVLVTSLSITL